MEKKDKIFEFEGFIIDENEKKLFQNQFHIHLTPKTFELLLFLVQNAGRFLTRDEILQEIWKEKYLDVNNNVIDPRISEIRKALGEKELGNFIATQRDGYKFVKEVRFKEINKSNLKEIENLRKSEISQNNFKTRIYEIKPLEINRKHIFFGIAGTLYAFLIIAIGISKWDCISDCFEKNLFIIIASISVGLAMANCLLLECAYQFDKFGWKTLLFLPVIFLINFGSMFTGLSLANGFSEYLIYSFSISLICYLSGQFVSLAIAKFILPNIPITIAKFETHPAFGAYWKNVLMYIFTLYFLFCILIYSFLFSQNSVVRQPLFPIFLFIIWLLFAFVSYYSTMYMLNNLVREKDGEIYSYHGFFVSLIFVRFVFFFLPTLVFIIWYFIRTIES